MLHLPSIFLAPQQLAVAAAEGGGGGGCGGCPSAAFKCRDSFTHGREALICYATAVKGSYTQTAIIIMSQGVIEPTPLRFACIMYLLLLVSYYLFLLPTPRLPEEGEEIVWKKCYVVNEKEEHVKIMAAAGSGGGDDDDDGGDDNDDDEGQRRSTRMIDDDLIIEPQHHRNDPPLAASKKNLLPLLVCM